MVPKLLILDFVSLLGKKSLKSLIMLAHLHTWVHNLIKRTFTVIRAISGGLVLFYARCFWERLLRRTSLTQKCPTTWWTAKSTLPKTKTSGKSWLVVSREIWNNELTQEPCSKTSQRQSTNSPFNRTSFLRCPTVTVTTQETSKWRHQNHFM